MYQVYIYLVYTWYIPGIYLVLLYVKIYFPNKVYVFILLNGFMSSISTSNVQNESFYAWGLFSQELHCVKDSSGICQEYTMIIFGLFQHYDIMFFNSLCFKSKEAMKLPPQVRSSMYRCILRRGAPHDPFKGMFY